MQTYTASGAYLGVQQAAGTATSATVSGLVPGASYLFGVLAESSGVFSSYEFSPTVTSTGYQGAAGTPVTTALPQPTQAAPPAATVKTLTSPSPASSGPPPNLNNIINSTSPATPALPSSGVVLGKEAWQTYENTGAGDGQTASVNVANGNLVVTAQDSTPIQAHGQLAYTIKRAYNSLDNSTLLTTPGSIGAGWRLNLGSELGDPVGAGILGTALSIPNPADLTAGTVTLIDEDGTHHTFTAKQTTPGLSIRLGRLPSAPGCTLERPDGTISCTTLDPLAAAYQLGRAATACADTSYTAPAGVHLSVYRVVAVQGVVPCPAQPALSPGAEVAGYVAVRPDRLTTVYASTGELLSMTDRAGVRLDYVYNAPPASGVSLGQLRYVYEPESCSGYVPWAPGATSPASLPATCRGFRLTYKTNPTTGQTSTVIVTDPAGRPTVYSLSTGPIQQLLRVTNTDGTTESYTYQGDAGCGGTAQQLCSITDAARSTTTFKYLAMSALLPAASLLATVTDRRGQQKAFSYSSTTGTNSPGNPASDTSSATLVTSSGPSGTSELRAYTIDNAGRVRSLSEGVDQRYYRYTTYTWDAVGATCDQPNATLDNNLCSVTRQQLSGSFTAPPSHATTYQYNNEGQPLVVTQQMGAGQAPLITTYGYTQEQLSLPAAGSQLAAHLDTYGDTIRGGGQVISTPGRPDSLFVLSDETAMLTARGNQASNWANYETTYGVDADSNATPGTIAAGHCGQGDTGLTCAVNSPSPAGGTAVTSFTYDSFGQRTSMTTPAVNAAGGTTAYTYSYLPDGTTDLSGTTNAGGWLATVTDPTGRYVAYGYDAAGNVARVWDRNATAGLPASAFPGTLTSPPSPAFSETLHADPGPTSTLTADQEQAAMANPWRWVWSSRDALGDRSHITHDSNGNAVSMTSARGTAVATPSSVPTTYTTTMTYDPGDLLLSVLTPAEAKTNGAPADEPTVYGYDLYGNRTSVTDPRGNVTTVTFDPVNRPTTTTWSRGPAAAGVPAGCRISSSSDTPIPTGLAVCSSTVAYDSFDQVIATTDATGAQSTSTYDAAGRRLTTTTPRGNNGIASTTTAKTYDADGHPLDVCSRRQFNEGNGVCDASSVYATHTAYNYAGLSIAVTVTTTQTSYTYGTTAIYDPNAMSPAGALRKSPRPATITTAYDANGNPVSVTDANGNTTVTGYDLLDRPVTITVPRSPGVTWTTQEAYDPAGNRTSTVQPITATTGRTTAWSFDADERLVDTVTGASNPIAAQAGLATGGANDRTRLVYDADGNTIGTFSARAFTSSITSPDARFLVRRDVDADSRTTATYTPRYDNADPNFTDPTGTPTADCPTGITPAAVTVPPANSTVPGYPSTVGVCVTRTAYDPDGEATTVTMPTAGGAQPGQTTRQMTATYTNDRLPSSVTGPSPTGTGTAVETAVYDAVGDLTSVTDPNRNTTTATYTFDHLKASITLPGYTVGSGTTATTVSHTSTYGYDANGDKVVSTDANNKTTHTGFTPDGRVDNISDPLGYVTGYAYDADGNTVASVTPAENPASPADSKGNRLAFQPTEYTYTADNLPATVTTPAAVDDPGGQGVAVRHITAYTYDGLGEKTAAAASETATGSTPGSTAGATVATAGNQGFTYTANGWLATQTGRSGETISDTYDADGHITAAADSTSNSTVTTTWTLDGLPRTVNDGNGSTTDSFNGAGRLLAEIQTVTGATANTTRTAYNDADLPISQTATAVAASATTPWTWSYDQGGRPVTATTPEGQSTASTYNPDDSLAKKTATRGTTQVSNYTYTYDNLSRILTANGTQLTPANTQLPQQQAYSYDADGRVVTNTDSKGAHTATYDFDGNRTVYTTPAGAGTAASSSSTVYNADDSVQNVTANTLPGASAAASTPQAEYYGPTGTLRSDTCNLYAYDGYDRLTGTTYQPTGPGCSSSSYASSAYTYDAYDRQRSDAQTTTSTSYDSLGNPTTTTAKTTTTYGYQGLTKTVATEASTANAHPMQYTITADGKPGATSWVDSGGTTRTQYYGMDGQGNVTMVTGAVNADSSTTGTSGVACATAYNPWGEQLTTTPTGAGSTTGTGVGATPSPCPTSATNGTSTAAGDMFYRGQRRDDSTGNYQLGSRTYDPAKTAFLSPDTYRTAAPTADVAVGTDPLTADRYNYVNGDPVNQTDANGHAPNLNKGKGFDDTNNAQDSSIYETPHGTAANSPRNAEFYKVNGGEDPYLPPPPPAPKPKAEPHHWYSGALHAAGSAAHAIGHGAVVAAKAVGHAAVTYGPLALTTLGEVSCVDPLDGICELDTAAEISEIGALTADTAVDVTANAAADTAAATEAQAAASTAARVEADTAASASTDTAATSADAAPETTGRAPSERVPSRERVNSCAGGESFTATTRVLLASGGTATIDTVVPGTKVLATDPATGKTVAEAVEALWVRTDTDLLDLTVRTPAGEATIHTTQHHPIYDATRHGWTNADQLHPGDELITPDGQSVIVEAEQIITGASAMWDLTVANEHDFFVATGVTSILVHNVNEDGCTPSDLYHSGRSPDGEQPIKGARPSDFHLAGSEADNEGTLLQPSSPVGNENVPGMSTYIDPAHMPLSGPFYRLPEGTSLPDGLGLQADGADVGGPMSYGHRTIYPTSEMTFGAFQRLVRSMPWDFAGRK